MAPVATSLDEGTAKFVHPTDFLPNKKWPKTQDLSGGGMPRRFQGTIFDLVVHGEIPREVEGTFYRILPDPAVPPTFYQDGNLNVPIDGDGTIAAFKFHNGVVDFRQRYVETDRLKLEMRARKSLFGLYRNPFQAHPCVRNAVDSTANTNIMIHAGKFVAMKESAHAYELNPHTLETLGYNPYGLPSKTMTAHPKLDAETGNLVGFGYEAKGLATRDIYFFELDKDGNKVNDLWFEGLGAYFIHDCALTRNHLCLMVWPFECNIERMKNGGHHWAYDYDQPVYWYVIPRKASSADQVKIYHWKNAMPIHTSGAYEDKDGKIIIDSSLVHGNAFPFFPPEKASQHEKAAADTTPAAQFVRWTIDPAADPSVQLPDPKVVLDVPSEFPQIDPRYMGKEFSSAFINVFTPDRSDGGKNVFQGLNGLAHYQRKKNDKVDWYYAGDNCLIQEPVFCPRSNDAEEGDGFVIALVDRLDEKRNEVVVIDTRQFDKPVAVVQLPFAIRSGVHGQWISASQIPDFDAQSQVDIPSARLWAKEGDAAYTPGI